MASNLPLVYAGSTGSPMSEEDIQMKTTDVTP